MPNITPNISFDVIAREWRCKWSEDNDKASLVALQDLLSQHMAAIKSVDGAKVQRVVCGGCHDFKVIISVPADKFGAFEGAEFAPEKEFLAAMTAIPGVTNVETQTYTLMEM